MKLNRKPDYPQGCCAVINTIEEAAVLLADANFRSAAVMMDALPPQLGMEMEYAGSVSVLRKMDGRFDVIVADGGSIADAARFMASLRAKQVKASGEPIATDRVPQTFAPDPDAPVIQIISPLLKKAFAFIKTDSLP